MLPFTRPGTLIPCQPHARWRARWYLNLIRCKSIIHIASVRARPQKRKKFQAYDGTNNIYNLVYEVLSWKVHRALIKAKLEPYLGFLHSIQYGKPSLICDL